MRWLAHTSTCNGSARARLCASRAAAITGQIGTQNWAAKYSGFWNRSLAAALPTHWLCWSPGSCIPSKLLSHCREVARPDLCRTIEAHCVICRLPSFTEEYTASTPLTRIRDIAHRNDIPHELKQEIKHTIQNKLHRNAGSDDELSGLAPLRRVWSSTVFILAAFCRAGGPGGYGADDRAPRGRGWPQ